MAYTDVLGHRLGGSWDWSVVEAVICPESYCRSARGYCCTTKTGKNSSTVHASRAQAYRDSR